MGETGEIIPASFFEREPLTCACELIGTELVWRECAGIVVETEAYLTENDDACHTFTRPSTRRFVEKNEPGSAYIYFNYGAHWMLNVLIKGGPRDGLILIRAIEPRRGLKLMKKRRGIDDLRRLCSGPGKLTQALDITSRHHEMSLCKDARYCFRRRETENVKVTQDARIGISRSVEFPWRFTLLGSAFVSVPVRTNTLRKR
jgi:DNA-3-methyladenine glycosylase